MCPLSKVIKRKSAYDMVSNEIHKLIEQIPHMVWEGIEVEAVM
jgi:hypothetical protein